MRFLELSRERLVDVLAGKRVGEREAKVFSTPPSGACVAVFSGELRCPTFVVVPDGELDDLYAWFAVLAPNLVPLSGYSTVVESRKFRAVHTPREAGLRVPDVAWRAMLGLVQGEALQIYGGRHPPERIGLLPYKTTLSWAFFQACRYDGADVAELTGRWNDARLLLAAKEVSYDVRAACEVWEAFIPILRGADGPPAGPVHEVLQWVVADSEAELPTCWNPYGDSLQKMTKGPLDLRVSILQELAAKLLRELEAEATREVILGAVAGFAVSLLSGGGNTRHSRLLEMFGELERIGLLWYGLFSAVAPRAARMGSGIALRLEHIASLEGRQDIALDELRVLARASAGDLRVALDLSSPIEVGLGPGVSVSVRPRLASLGVGREDELI